MGSWTRLSLTTVGLALLALLPASGVEAQQSCYERLPTDRIALELRAADIQSTLRLLAQQYRINLVVTDEVAGTITLSLFAVPVREVFKVIVESSALQCIEREGLLRVSSIERLRKEEEDSLKAEESKFKAQLSEAEARIKQTEIRAKEADNRVKLAEAEGKELELAQTKARGAIREEMIRLLYTDAEQVADTLRGILGLPKGQPTAPPPGIYTPALPTVIGAPPFPTPPALAPAAVPGTEITAKGLTVEAHKPTNSIFIRYYEADLERIKKLIKEKLDVPLPQVQIAARMVITTKNALEQIGVQWGATVVTQDSARANTLVGRGFAAPVSGTTGLPALQTTGIGVGFQPANPTFTKTTILPVDPATGLPTGGNLVNLATAFLPTGGVPPAMGLLFGIIGSQFNINLAIQALETEGKARSLAEPKIVTVENAKATMARGFEVPYVTQTGFGGTQVQFKDALLKLEVTPTVIREDATTRIRMKVVVENNEPDFTRAVQGNPPIFKRRGETEVVVREGERLVIGGVMLERDDTTLRQVPVLGRIPLLGWLFKSREISSTAEELILIITPTVLLPANAAQR